MLIVKRKMNKLIKKIMAVIMAAAIITAVPAVSADAMTEKQVNAKITAVQKRIAKNKKHINRHWQRTIRKIRLTTRYTASCTAMILL